eukprot:c15559_g1_i1.p1 GENE.c15559_g1_i1~~c15559_g1_i1.p1  ORF type:complete len:133 (+),score=21.79 c15559_g1_i1:35-400(+)
MVQSKLASKSTVNLREKKQSRAKGAIRPKKQKHFNSKQLDKKKLQKAIVGNVERIMANRVEEYSNISSTRNKLVLITPEARNPILDKGKKNVRKVLPDGTNSILLDRKRAKEKAEGTASAH